MTIRIGNTVFIQEEAADICEDCGKVDELRPYGKFDAAKGRRLRVCFDCAGKNPAERDKAFSEVLSGKLQ